MRRNARRPAAAIAATVGCVLVGAVGATAVDLFSGRATQALAPRINGFNVAPATDVKRASATTPDGGLVELWTATGRDECMAMVFGDPGRTLPGKPYRPSNGAFCESPYAPGRSLEVAGRWVSRRTGKVYSLIGGFQRNAITVTYAAPHRAKVTGQARRGYYLMFVPGSLGTFHFNKLKFTYRSH